jgi:hypothetical protein
MPELHLPQQLARILRPRIHEMVAELRDLVECESPSLEKFPADRCCTVLADKWRKRGVRVERLAQKHRGDHLRVT